jgi:hypothetical protein
MTIRSKNTFPTAHIALVMAASLITSVAAAQASDPFESFSPAPPAIADGASVVRITGSIDGEEISDFWDFSLNPDGVTTNGLMSSQISSSVGSAASLYFDNDFTQVSGIRPQGADQWYFRFTLGNAARRFEVYDAKESFSIPPGPYAMVTARRGPDGREYRHREFDEDNLIRATVSLWEYDKDNGTLRVAGSMLSVWTGSGDWLRFDFDVLLGGPDDRNARFNRNTFRYAFN